MIIEKKIVDHFFPFDIYFSLVREKKNRIFDNLDFFFWFKFEFFFGPIFFVVVVVLSIFDLLFDVFIHYRNASNEWQGKIVKK